MADEHAAPLHISSKSSVLQSRAEHGVMVHRARRESHSSHKMGAVAVANTGVPPCQQQQVPTSYQPESASIPACQCSAFLDPYPSPQAQKVRQ